MRYPIVILICFIFSSQINAQQWISHGATWYYNIGHAFKPYNGYIKWEEQGQVMKNGKLCWVVKADSFPYYITGNDWYAMYTYEDSGRVYWLNEYTNQFTVLYDFNKKVGESWILEMDSCQFTMTVDSVKNVVIGGITRKAMEVSGPGLYMGWCYEGIGSLQSPYPDISFACHFLIIDGFYYHSIRCYEDDSIGTHHFDSSPSCQYTGIEDQNPKMEVQFFPNPVNDELYIKTEWTAYQLYVFNASGQLVQSENLKGHSRIDVGDLPSGFYIGRLSSEGIFKGSFRFVKK